MYKDVISIFGGSSFLAQELIAVLIPQGWTINLFTANVLESKNNLENNGLLSPNINFFDSYEKIPSATVESSYFIINMMQGPISFDNQSKAYTNAFKNFIEVTSKTKENRIIHLSCLGANSLVRNSPYLKEKGRQEDTIKLRTNNHSIIRLGMLFGKEDSFFNTCADNFGKNRQLCLPSQAKQQFWQFCYIGDVVLAINKILNQPEIYSSKVYELHSGEVLNVVHLMRKISQYTGYSDCSVLTLSEKILKVSQKIPFLSKFTTNNPNHQMMFKSSFLASNEAKFNGFNGFSDLNIKPTETKEVMPLYLFRN